MPQTVSSLIHCKRAAGWSIGFFVAAIFSAAISTLNSALAEGRAHGKSPVCAPVQRSRRESPFADAPNFYCVLGAGFLRIGSVFLRYSAQGMLQATFKLPNRIYGAILLASPERALVLAPCA